MSVSAIIDRVAILADFQDMDYDQRNPALFALVDYLHCFHYPNIIGGEKNNFSAFEGDPLIVKVPFRVETLSVDGVIPVLMSAGIQIIATKSGLTDFILEQKTFNTKQICKLNNYQDISINESRGYISYANDPYNTASLQTKTAYDSGTMKGFELAYGFIARYEYWNSVFSQLLNECNQDIFNDNAVINNEWGTIAGGWALKVRFTAQVQGYDGITTPFQADTAIVVKSNTLATTAPTYTARIQFFDSDNNEVSGIISRQHNSIAGQAFRTRIRTTWTSSMESLPAGYAEWYGTIFIDKVGGGGASRRFASTEVGSESDSPFTPSTTIAGAASQYANGNMRIGIMDSQTIITETIYDDEVGQLADDNVIVYPRLGLRS